MTHKKRTFVLMTTVLGVAFTFLPASPRAATLDQIEAPRETQQSPRREAEDLQAPRGRTSAKPDEMQAPRGTDTAPADDTQAPHGGAATAGDISTGVVK